MIGSSQASSFVKALLTGRGYHAHPPALDQLPALSVDAPALVDVAVTVDRGDLKRGPIRAGDHGVRAAVHGHLLRVGPAHETLGEDAAVHPLAVVETERGENGGRHVHVAGGRAGRDALLEVGTPAEKRVANVPRAHAAVIARVQRGPAAHAGEIAPRHAERVGLRGPRKRHEQVGSPFAASYLYEFEGERAVDRS